ncbi:MAG: orotate phosphoribosyltransferase [Flavobacteriales bacterium]|jgi:orotate phosphoribosyltransferase|nr:orotate phosphoribosyltransferase [Flavobacteriales bacterium]
MNNRIESELKVAEFLLQIKAVKLTPSTPITWASGWKSPIYCDNRKTLSYPQIRTYIRQQFVDLITDEFGKPDVIAGVATGGIAMGALVAQDLGIPFVYVRSSAKAHGLTNQIEGVLEQGQSVVVLEDLVSTGNSSLTAVKALKEAGATIKGMAAIFTYGFAIAEENFKAANCKLATLTNYDSLLQQALNTRFVKDEEIDALKDWRKSPSTWDK